MLTHPNPRHLPLFASLLASHRTFIKQFALIACLCRKRHRYRLYGGDTRKQRCMGAGNVCPLVVITLLSTTFYVTCTCGLCPTISSLALHRGQLVINIMDSSSSYIR